MRREPLFCVILMIFPAIFGCGPRNDNTAMVAMGEKEKQYAETDEQHLSMVSFVDDAKKRQYAGKASVEPSAKDKRVQALVRDLQSKWPSDVLRAEDDFERLADPLKFNPKGAQYRDDALRDLVALLDHNLGDTRSAAIRILVKCYTGKTDKKYVWFVLDKFNDPLQKVRSTAWDSLTRQYGTVLPHQYLEEKQDKRDAYINKWREWYRREIDSQYKGELPND